jgi:hypothetical protein
MNPTEGPEHYRDDERLDPKIMSRSGAFANKSFAKSSSNPPFAHSDSATNGSATISFVVGLHLHQMRSHKRSFRPPHFRE